MKKYILFFLCFFLVGCDAKEIRDLSITSTMGIDFVDDRYKVSVIVIGKDEGESKLYTAYGKSFFKAIQNVNDKLTETLYFGHMQNVIVSEDVSRLGLADILSYFMKEDIIQNNFYLFLAKDTEASLILKYLMENSGYTLSNIFKENHLLDLKRNDNSINAFIHDLEDKHKDPVIHSLSLSSGALSLDSLALFKKDKLVCFSDIVGYYLLKSNAKQIYLSFPCDKKETTFSIDSIFYHTTIQKNQVIHHISGNLSIKENGCKLKTKTEEDILKMKKEVEKMMLMKINTFLFDQKKWDVQPIHYKSFFTSRKYDSIVSRISLQTKNLKDKGNLHE